MRLVYLLATAAICVCRPATASISETMIVEMREITSVSVSPDGRLAVVGICHPNPRVDKRDLSWLIVPLHDGGALKSVPAGEEIYNPDASGTLLSRQALWSRDGKWFFYLRRDGEEVQVWATRSDGGVTQQMTHSKSDLVDLKRSSDPDEFIVQLAPDRATLRKAEDDEYRNGVLYDDHILGGFPLFKTLPVIDRWRSVRRTDKGEWLPPGWRGQTTAIFDVRVRQLRKTTETNPTEFTASESSSHRVKVIALGTVPKNPHDYVGKYTLQLEPKAGNGSAQYCEIAECIAKRISAIGWSPDGAEIYYLADTDHGPLNSRSPGASAIYAWNPHRNTVRLIHDAGGTGLMGRLYNLDIRSALSIEPSPIVGREIVIAFAGADEPPRLEAVDLDTGSSRTLYDPNAELRALTSGHAMWRTWETSMGYVGHGIMVLPTNYRPGEKYPMVITTYGCGRGFLRGGSGDNAPEFVLAHHGFIAVCVDVPVAEIIAHEPDPARLYPIYCDIILGLIADLSREGNLDSTRVGLSGHSLGADAGTYCVSHSNAFAASAFRHGSVIERANWDLFDTAAWMRGPDGFFGLMQMPDPRNDPTHRWGAMSAAQRAREINTPTLLQLDDAEYLSALPLWSAMREEGKAIEMHIFPEEAHLLAHPIHTLVNFQRQVDWFAFWLKHEDTEPSKRGQYDRWNRLRESTGNSEGQH